MTFRYYILVLFVVTLTLHLTSTQVYNDVKLEYERLLDAYKSGGITINDAIPRDSTSFPITVNIGMSVFAVMEYNAVSGRIQLIGSLSLSWRDDSLTTLSALSATDSSVETIFVSNKQIWTPSILLINDASSIERIGDVSYKVRYNLTSGYCEWNPRLLIDAVCAPDMTYFPFDKQTCVLKIRPTSRDSGYLTLVANGEWNTGSLEKSAVWDISETSSSVSVINKKYQADFTIIIKRKPLFLAFVIVMPIMLLSLLSGFIFLLPPGSGERTGFGTICFLSFVFLLQTLMGLMPEVSSPMSLLCYYVIVMLGFSVVLCIVNVFLMRMHLNPSKGQVPKLLVYFIETITCKICRRCKTVRVSCCCKKKKIELAYFQETNGNLIKSDRVLKTRFSGIVPYFATKDYNDVMKPSNDDVKKPIPRLRSAKSGLLRSLSNVSRTTSPSKIELTQRRLWSSKSADGNETCPGYKTSITWEDIGKTLDMFLIVAFCGVQTVFSLFFLVPIGSQYAD